MKRQWILMSCMPLFLSCSGEDGNGTAHSEVGDLMNKRQPIIDGKIDISHEYDGVVNLFFHEIPLKELAKFTPDLEGNTSDKTVDGDFCSASLINERTVLTAAHCVYYVKKYDLLKYAEVRVGTIAEEASEDRRYKIESIHIHPDYSFKNIMSGTDMKNDIAIVKLSRSVKGVESFRLPLGDLAVNSDVITMKKSDYPYPQNAKARKFPVTEVGFGANHVLGTERVGRGIRRVTNGMATVYSFCSATDAEDDICRINIGEFIKNAISPQAYEFYRQQPAYAKVLETDYSLQANIILTPSYESGTCQGDSGGPILTKLNGKNYIVGVTSFGINCEIFSAYTATWPYWDNFIRQYVETEICDNGKDEDHDGHTDCEDADCKDANECRFEICDNGKDDNGDGHTDCADVACKESSLCKVEICDNGKDDNGDGHTDCADVACRESSLCKVEICDNGKDDNGDGHTDCDDLLCRGIKGCSSEHCSNGADDNGDGKIDCDDKDCKKYEGCSQTPERNNNGGSSCSVSALNGRFAFPWFAVVVAFFPGMRRRIARRRVR